jgi:transcriptional regulator with XRE-family HTH domain
MDGKHPLRKFREGQTPAMSQAGLAKLLKVSRPTAHRWETGARKIGIDSLPLVSEKTGIPKRELRPDLAEKLEEAQ